MRKTIYILLVLMVFGLVSCDAQFLPSITTGNDTTNIETTIAVETTSVLTTDNSTTEATTVTSTEPVTTEALTEISTTQTTETTGSYEAVIDDVYLQLMNDMPTEISADYTLPSLEMDGLSIEYYYNDELLVDDVLNYQAQSFSETINIYLLIVYHNASKSYQLQIVQLRDEDLYQQETNEARFNEVFNILTSMIPEQISSDFTLPDHDINGIQITYDVDQTTIENGRLIFTFPSQEQVIQLSMTLSYEDEVRYLSLPITLTAYNDLPRIPEIHIVTDNEISIESKEEYVYGNVNVYDYDEDNNQIILLSQTRMQIRLRGNSSLYMPKKSYKIKFVDKQFMFSDYKEKDWVLIANFADQTLLRNALAYQMANDLDMAFSPMVKFVDVYVNGVYQGNYLLTDQVEVTNDRVDIEENTPNIDTGYLLEYDKKLYEVDFNTDENYFMIDAIPFVIKSPDFEDSHYSHEQYEFIENYMQGVYHALVNQEDYHAWIDEASFIDWFIVNEIFKNQDSGYSSVFYYKDAGGLLKMGPVWDFDLSTGNYGIWAEYVGGPEGWYTSLYEKNLFFYYLMQYDSFKSALKARWNEVYDDVILKSIDQIYPMADSMSKSRYDNFIQWDIIGSYEDWYISSEILALDTYQKQLEFLRNFLILRIDWLNDEINQFD